MFEQPEVIGLLEVGPKSRHAVVERRTGVIERPLHVPREEHEASVGGSAIEVAVLAAIQRKEVPGMDVARHGTGLHEGGGIDQPLDLILRVGARVNLLEETDQGAVIVLVLARALHPFAVVAPGVVRSLVAPVGITVVPAPVILEPPFVVDLVQLALAAVLVGAVEHVIADDFHFLPDRAVAAVDLHHDELVLVGRISQQVEPVADHPVVAPPAHVVVAVQELCLAAKQVVLRELELGAVDVAAAGPRTAGGPDLAAVDDVLLIDDNGGVEVMIGQARERVAVGSRRVVTIGDGPQVQGGDHEAHPPQVPRAGRRIDHVHGRATAPLFGLSADLPVGQHGLDVKLHDLAVLTILGQFRRVDAVTGLFVAAGYAVVKHGLAGPGAGVGVIVQTMVQPHVGRGSLRQHASAHSHGFARGRHGRVMYQPVHLGHELRAKTGILCPGSPEIRRHGQRNARGDAVVPGLSNHARGAGDPAGIETDFVRLVGLHSGDVDLDAVGPVVPVAVRYEMKLPAFQVAGVMRALGQPSAGAAAVSGHRVPIEDQVDADAARADLDILQDDVAVADEEEVQFLIVRGRAVRIQLSEDVGITVVLERCFVGFIAVEPGGGPAVVHPGISQLHAAAVAVGQVGPMAARQIVHLVGQVAPLVHQPDRLALIAQAALEVADHRDIAVGGAHPIGVGRHDQIAVRRDGRSKRNRIIHTIDELPAGDVHRRSTTIVKLDELA